MSKYIPAEVLAAARRQLWKVIRQVQYAEGDFGRGTAAARDCEEVEKVLRVAVDEMDKIVRRETEKEPNSRNVRQAQEFALKASVAKAGGAAPAHTQLCPASPSHK